MNRGQFSLIDTEYLSGRNALNQWFHHEENWSQNGSLNFYHKLQSKRARLMNVQVQEIKQTTGFDGDNMRDKVHLPSEPHKEASSALLVNNMLTGKNCFSLSSDSGQLKPQEHHHRSLSELSQHLYSQNLHEQLRQQNFQNASGFYNDQLQKTALHQQMQLSDVSQAGNIIIIQTK